MDGIYPVIHRFPERFGGVSMERSIDLRSKCDQMRNESWIKLSKYSDDLLRIIDNNGKPENQHDKDVMLLAAMTASQHLTVNHAEDNLFDLPEYDNEACTGCDNPVDLCTCNLKLEAI